MLARCLLGKSGSQKQNLLGWLWGLDFLFEHQELLVFFGQLELGFTAPVALFLPTAWPSPGLLAFIRGVLHSMRWKKNRAETDKREEIVIKGKNEAVQISSFKKLEPGAEKGTQSCWACGQEGTEEVLSHFNVLILHRRHCGPWGVVASSRSLGESSEPKQRSAGASLRASPVTAHCLSGQDPEAWGCYWWGRWCSPVVPCHGPFGLL